MYMVSETIPEVVNFKTLMCKHALLKIPPPIKNLVLVTTHMIVRIYICMHAYICSDVIIAIVHSIATMLQLSSIRKLTCSTMMNASLFIFFGITFQTGVRVSVR